MSIFFHFEEEFAKQTTWSVGFPIGKCLFKVCLKTLEQDLYPAGIYLFKMNNETTRTMCEICSGVSIVDFEELNTEAVTGGVLK